MQAKGTLGLLGRQWDCSPGGPRAGGRVPPLCPSGMARLKITDQISVLCRGLSKSRGLTIALQLAGKGFFYPSCCSSLREKKITQRQKVADPGIELMPLSATPCASGLSLHLCAAEGVRGGGFGAQAQAGGDTAEEAAESHPACLLLGAFRALWSHLVWWSRPWGCYQEGPRAEAE